MTVQTKTKLKRYAVYGVIILLAHIFQNILTIFPQIASVRPVLLISVALCISMFEGEVVGAVAGLLSGALWDTFTVTADGYNALYLMVACAVCGVLLRIFMRNNIITYIMMNTGFTTLYFLSYVLFFITARGIDGGAEMLLRYYLPMGIYSLVLTPFWYVIIRAINRKFSYSYTEY
ncbi:MAG: rod shape-determining protein MreD [Clostridia bacterium]|nr:rod shape-determining protein MreD [Clostridia bacterium]